MDNDTSVSNLVGIIPARELAVEIVDGVSGYTIENSPHRETHSRHYDQVEERLTAFFGTPSEQFAKWLELGPKIAKTAGCYVGIKVSVASVEVKEVIVNGDLLPAWEADNV